jgi:hypothetical protein
MKGSLKSAQFVNKHGCIRQFLFLLGRFLKLFSETEPKKSKILQETSMKGLQDFLISSRLDKNMVTMGNSCF